ncbi:MAG: hypothetical protein ACTSQJ_08830, partial [Promethearchaeota archaeon]
FLLMIVFVCFGLLGSNLHDVIWCGIHTDWYEKEHLAGDDIAFFFNIFGIYDKDRYDYRTFGLFMLFQVLIEFIVGTIAFYKFYEIDKEKHIKTGKKSYVLSYLMLVSAGIILGIIEFIFDSPWFFTDIEYKIDVFLGIPLIGLYFILIGFYLGVKTKV